MSTYGLYYYWWGCGHIEYSKLVRVLILVELKDRKLFDKGESKD